MARRISLFSTCAFLLCHLAVNSTLIGLAGRGAFRFALGGEALFVVVGIALALRRHDLIPSLLSVAALLLIALQISVFSFLTGQEPNWNVGLAYIPVAAVALFANTRRDLSSVLSFLFCVALTYCAVYVIFGGRVIALNDSDVVQAGTEIAGKVLAEDGVRAPRMYLAAGYAAFCFYYSLVHLRYRRKRLPWLLSLAIGVSAIYLSMSRVFMGEMLFVTALTFMNVGRRQMRLLFATIFTVAVILNLAGILLSGWNPYALFSFDVSGSARAEAYKVFRPLVVDNWLFGIGIAPSTSGLSEYIRADSLFWEDVGPLGIWLSFGLAGLGSFLWMSFVSILGVPEGKVPISSAELDAMSLTGLTFGLASFYSPDIWGGSSYPVICMILAIWLGARRGPRPKSSGTVGIGAPGSQRRAPSAYENRPIDLFITG